MIALATDRAALRRFVLDLVAQAEKPLPKGAPDLAGFSAEDVEAARLGWAGRIVDEYRSVVVFSDLLHRMADLEQPFAALCAVQRIIGDELRHTWVCAEVVGWLGGMRDLAIDLDGLGIEDSDEPSAARVLEIVARELVVAETESIRVLEAYRNATTAPEVRSVIDGLLCDEVRHAAAGRELLALLEQTLSAKDVASLRERLPAIMTADRERLHALYRSSARGGPGRGLGASLSAEDLAPCTGARA